MLVVGHSHHSQIKTTLLPPWVAQDFSSNCEKEIVNDRNANISVWHFNSLMNYFCFQCEGFGWYNFVHFIDTNEYDVLNGTACIFFGKY